jgi:Xaa-Pro aminopeptidase
VEPIWVQNVKNNQWFSDQAGKDTADFIRQLDLAKGTVAVEKCFIPVNTLEALHKELPQTRFVDALPILEELRAVKRPDELVTLKEATEEIIESMLTIMRSTKAGTTTREIAQRLHLEEIRRGLNFEYCLVSAGPNFNRAPSDARWEKGDILSLDSGGNKDGYLGDLCRMAVMGKPTPLMQDLLAEVRAVQAAARRAVQAGRIGGEIYEEALAEQARCPHGDEMAFLAHGMGIVQHELPRLTNSGPIPYTETHANRPLDAGMVLSIETDLKNKEVGFVKLEDTVVVTEDGWEAYGDRGRDWVVVEE